MSGKKGDARLARVHTLIQRARGRGGERATALGAAHSRLLAIAGRLEPSAEPLTEQPPCGAVIRQRVETALADLTTALTDGSFPAWLQPALSHLVTVLRRLGAGLYHCYDVPGVPRTANELAHCYRHVKASERRISGRKRSDSFVVRVGGFAVYAITAAGLTEPVLRQRLAAVPAPLWLAARATLRANQERQTKMRRFRLHRVAYLADLEARWTRLADTP